MIKKISILILGILFTSFILVDKTFSLDELIGKGNPVLFGDEYKLQKEVDSAFILMKEAALLEEINIQIVSSYRSFEHQKSIWTRKYNTFITDSLSPQEAINKIIEYSTIPGTSRHHWGTDIDIIDENVERPKSVLNAKNFNESGAFYKLKLWLDENAERFGFYLVYADTIGRKGFKYEPWHYSYLPISKEMLKQYQKMDIQKLLKEEKLIGSEYFSDVFITKYIDENILDINPDLK